MIIFAGYRDGFPSFYERVINSRVSYGLPITKKPFGRDHCPELSITDDMPEAGGGGDATGAAPEVASDDDDGGDDDGEPARSRLLKKPSPSGKHRASTATAADLKSPLKFSVSKRKPTAPATATTAILATPPAPTTAAANQSVFDQLPDSAWVRQSQLVRMANNPASTAPLPFSAPTLWRKVKDGTFPAPAKLSTRVTAWKCADVRAWMNAQTAA